MADFDWGSIANALIGCITLAVMALGRVMFEFNRKLENKVDRNEVHGIVKEKQEGQEKLQEYFKERMDRFEDKLDRLIEDNQNGPDRT